MPMLRLTLILARAIAVFQAPTPPDTLPRLLSLLGSFDPWFNLVTPRV